jgi:hypothetical protein
MSCCGQNRRAAATPSRIDAHGIAIEYRGRRGEPVEVVGVTGRTYAFSDSAPIQTVHSRDARWLLDSGHFRLV